MSIKVSLPGVLAKLTDGQNTLDADGSTVAQVVSDLAARYPGLGPRLQNADGEPYEFVTIYLNEEDIRLAGGFEAAVSAGDELTVVPAVAGG